MNVILYTSAVPRFVSISHQVYREICPTSTPTKPLTAFRIITFPSFYLMPKSQRQVLCSTSHRNALLLCSTNHTTVGHVSFGWSIYLHFLLMSSTVPKPKWIHRAKKKKKKGRQISNRKPHAHAEKVFHYFLKDCQGFSQGAHDPRFISLPFSLIFLLFFHK